MSAPIEVRRRMNCQIVDYMQDPVLDEMLRCYVQAIRPGYVDPSQNATLLTIAQVCDAAHNRHQTERLNKLKKKEGK
jgi:hypothetical protein